jgi:hypothetical protein
MVSAERRMLQRIVGLMGVLLALAASAEAKQSCSESADVAATRELAQAQCACSVSKHRRTCRASLPSPGRRSGAARCRSAASAR